MMPLKKLILRSISIRMVSVFLVLCLTAGILPLAQGASAAEDTTGLSITAEDPPAILEEIDASGFKHPGVGLTKEILENMRTQVRAQKEPWSTYYAWMLQSPTASRTVTSSNQSGTDPTKPASDAFNSQGFNSRFIADGLKAYTQSLLYVITGDEVYRANAMRIIRIWSQMDPAKYAYFTDAHIHTGIPLNRMVTAAEILKYTSTDTEELKWTAKDTADFTAHLIHPVIETFQHHNGYFMNQHLYPLLGAMSGYIFTGNRERYNEGVEWFTVNRTAVDQGQNGAIQPLFRLVDTNILTGEKVDPPRVQHVEMGRDQAHGAGDLTNVQILSRLLLAQGTEVDPVEGTVSMAENAVNPFEFLDRRILKAADYFARFMLGYDTPWTPVAAHTDAEGNPTIIYKELSEAYRGRIGGNVYDLYYYYKYAAGVNMEAEAPYFTEMFAKRLPFYWESPDGGADYWLFIPKEAESEGTRTLPKAVTNPDLRELEDRYTRFDPRTVTMQEGDTSFVRFTAAEEGSRVALVGSATGEKIIGFRIRTDGTAKLEMNYGINDTLTLPDTKGEWRYITYDMGNLQGLGDLIYFKVKGPGTTVDIDHIHVKAKQQLTPPVFKEGNAPLHVFTYAGSQASVQYDFSAGGAGSADVLTYQIDGGPEGALLDAGTGAFSWKPAVAGTYSFVVSASDGTTLSARDVTMVVSPDRPSALEAVIAPYNETTSYVSSTLDRYKTAHQEAKNLIATASDEVFIQKLMDLRRAVEGLEELTPLLQDGSMDYTHMLATSTFGDAIPNLLDRYAGSFVWYGAAANQTHLMDFGRFKMSAEAFELQVRASFPERIGGVALFGSDDKLTWTRLTEGTTKVTEEMQRLEVKDEYKETPFRFLKMQMIEPSSTMLEVAEFRIHGQRHETVNKLELISLRSEPNIRGRIVPGNTIQLVFHSTEVIQQVDVHIQGRQAAVQTEDGLHWTAQLTADPSLEPGPVRFSIRYRTAVGTEAEEAVFTTDGSSLYLADESALLTNVLEIAGLSDSNGRSPSDLLKVAGALFDGNPGTLTDFRLNGSGSGGYITFDFKDSPILLTKLELLARQDSYYTRIGGTVVQGSHDNSTWTTISPAAASTLEWQELKAIGTAPYRYIRIYNKNNWFGNMSEVRLHADRTPPITTAVISPSKPDGTNGWYVRPVTVTLNAEDRLSGVTGSVYSLDGGSTWLNYSGNITLDQDGPYTLAYRSSDRAGNVEAAKSIHGKRDAAAPAITVTGLVYEAQALPSSGDLRLQVSVSDNQSGVEGSRTQAALDGQPYRSGDLIRLYTLPLGKHTLAVHASDLAGNTARTSVAFETYASLESLKDLVKRFTVSGLIDNAGVADSLQQKLIKGNVEEFILEVQAQSGMHIQEEAARYLLRDAHFVAGY
ncbi:hypothetical protein J2T17_001723 [Paenibacillus mucilaginosus]|uniref:OmpL47-type beta-barrel domain-containing protein n=1 Tax=Paenibacillus mucilaginosus TaxID=61624 RepID=UPI003D222FA5